MTDDARVEPVTQPAVARTAPQDEELRRVVEVREGEREVPCDPERVGEVQHDHPDRDREVEPGEDEVGERIDGAEREREDVGARACEVEDHDGDREREGRDDEHGVDRDVEEVPAREEGDEELQRNGEDEVVVQGCAADVGLDEEGEDLPSGDAEVYRQDHPLMADASRSRSAHSRRGRGVGWSFPVRTGRGGAGTWTSKSSSTLSQT